MLAQRVQSPGRAGRCSRRARRARAGRGTARACSSLTSTSAGCTRASSSASSFSSGQLGEAKLAGREIDETRSRSTPSRRRRSRRGSCSASHRASANRRPCPGETMCVISRSTIFPGRGSRDLVAHRHAPPGLDQPPHVALRRVMRDAAHRHLVALGQRDIEDGRRLLRVLEKHLVEIPEPEEQQRLRRQAPPDALVLLHHRGEGFGHVGAKVVSPARAHKREARDTGQRAELREALQKHAYRRARVPPPVS